MDPGAVFYRLLQHIIRYDDPRGAKLSHTNSYVYADQILLNSDGTPDIEAEELVRLILGKRKLKDKLSSSIGLQFKSVSTWGPGVGGNKMRVMALQIGISRDTHLRNNEGNDSVERAIETITKVIVSTLGDVATSIPGVRTSLSAPVGGYTQQTTPSPVTVASSPAVNVTFAEATTSGVRLSSGQPMISRSGDSGSLEIQMFEEEGVDGENYYPKGKAGGHARFFFIMLHHVNVIIPPVTLQIRVFPLIFFDLLQF